MKNELEKEFVPPTESLELKKLGFDKPCLKFYVAEKLVLALDAEEGDTNSKLDGYNPLYVSAPTFSQAFRFFRDKYGLFIRSDFDVNYLDKLDEFQTTYFFSILKMEESLVGFKPLGRLNNEKSYEEAELECLKKLIEIVKSKKED